MSVLIELGSLNINFLLPSKKKGRATESGAEFVLFQVALDLKAIVYKFFFFFLNLMDLGLCLESINEMTLGCVCDLLTILSFRQLC